MLDNGWRVLYELLWHKVQEVIKSETYSLDGDETIWLDYHFRNKFQDEDKEDLITITGGSNMNITRVNSSE